MKKRVLSAILSVSLAVPVVSGGLLTSDVSAKKTATLNVGISSDIVSLDPAFAYDSTTVQVVDQLTEGLLAYDNNNKVVGKLAKSWKAVNNKTYVYEIKNNVHFSDGSPMTIDDVLFSLNRTKNPATASNEGWMYSNVASITKTGPWEITVKLSKPDSTWQYVFATTGGHIISKKYYDAHKNSFGKPNGGVLGTGPYVFKKWVTGSEIDLEKSKNYWDKSSKTEIDNIKYKVIPENSTLLTAVKTGQVDVTIIPPADTVEQYKSYNNVKTILNEGYQGTELGFNCQRAPFNDVNVRRAVSCLVDTEAINKNITKDDILGNALPFGKKVAAFNTNDWTKFGNTTPNYKYSVKKAKEYLAKSKYPKGFSCNIVVSSTDSANNSIALALQQALKELKINLSIKKYPYNDFVSYAYGNHVDSHGKRDYDMLIWSWLSDWPDPAGYMIPLYSSANAGKGGSNWSAYSNPQFDKLMDQQNETLDTTKRTQLLEKAVKIATDDAAYRVIGYPKDCFVINKKFSYKPSASWFYNFFIKDFKVN